jgi:hypothetical protein
VFLFYGYFGAGDCTAAERFVLSFGVLYDTVLRSVNGEVAAKHCAFTGALAHANLADDNLANFYFFATKELNAKALAGTIVDIFGGTACFYM